MNMCRLRVCVTSYEKRPRKITSERSVNKTSGCDFWWFLRWRAVRVRRTVREVLFFAVDTQF